METDPPVQMVVAPVRFPVSVGVVWRYVICAENVLQVELLLLALTVMELLDPEYQHV